MRLKKGYKSYRVRAAIAGIAGSFCLATTAGAATDAELEVARKWLDEFQPSTLSREEQMDELEWFIDAAKRNDLVGMDIQVASEQIATHKYESNTLAKAFSEITGINLTHEVMPEGQIVKNVEKEMQNEANLYDAYINDTDLIGTHFRYGDVEILSEYMEGEGSDVTLPTLDIQDFIGREFGTGPGGRLYQLPDQQFANLYWFRYDWFQKPGLRRRFEQEYGYELGVPKNWAAYEDIAEFFTNQVDTIDGREVYGHMDYGKPGPSLQWRFTDAWFSMAGAGSPGLPNGRPVDEWGIRVWGCHPVGSSVKRGGATNGPAAEYALQKYLKWLNNYAPPGAADMNFTEAGPVPGEGQIAQQIFWYTAFTASLAQEDKPVTDAQGNPKWRMAPSPHGAYWEEGMKLGYQDAGAWTLFKHTPEKRQKAAWLYAQFTVAKTTSLKKLMVGLTPIRESDIESKAFGDRSEELGGLVEFYRSPARERWTPTGINVPDYPALFPKWSKWIAKAASGELSAQKALDGLAGAQDDVLQRLSRGEQQSYCKPSLYVDRGREFWLNQEGAPKAQLSQEQENPQGETIRYDELIQRWEAEETGTF